MDDGRRIVRVPLNPLVLDGMLKGDVIGMGNLPDGARQVGAYFAEDEQIFYLLYEHEMFGLVAEGDVIPVYTVTVERWVTVRTLH